MGNDTKMKFTDDKVDAVINTYPLSVQMEDEFVRIQTRLNECAENGELSEYEKYV